MHIVLVVCVGVMSKEEHAMPPLIFPHIVGFNDTAYIETLDTVANPWIDDVDRGKAVRLPV